MPKVNNLKITIGGAESPAGSAAARTVVVPITGPWSLDRKPGKALDPAIVGLNMASGEYMMYDDIAGGGPVAFRPVAGVGKLLKSALGSDLAAPPQIVGLFRFKYIGASASCKVVAAAGTLNSKIGVLAAEANDAAFGTTGTITTSGAAFDTLGELVAVIDAYADYMCEKIFGADAAATTAMVAFAGGKQAKNQWCYVWVTGTSGVYLHTFTPDNSDTERPTMSIQKDMGATADNFLYTGCVVDTFSISGELKGMVAAECSILGFAETIGQAASVLTLADVDPMKFYDGGFGIAGTLYTYLRNIRVNVGNSHNPEGYGQGSISRQYQQKGVFTADGDFTLRCDAVSYLERAKIFANTRVPLTLRFQGKIITGVVPELCLIEIPAAYLKLSEFPENAGQFDIKLNFTAVDPKGTFYDEPISIHLLTTDSATY